MRGQGEILSRTNSATSATYTACVSGARTAVEPNLYYYYSKFHAISWAIAISVVAGVGASFAVGEIKSVSIAIVCGALLLIAFYIFVMFVTLRSAFDGKPVIVISEACIFDRRVSPKPIKWDLIRSIRLDHSRGGPYLQLSTIMQWKEYIELEGQTLGGVLDHTVRLNLRDLSSGAEEIEAAITGALRNFHPVADNEKNGSEHEVIGLQGRKSVGFLAVIGALIYVLSLLYFLYGFFNFPDSIEPCGVDRYCGVKFGKLHSESEYKAYKLWSEGLWVLMPSVFVVGYICRLGQKTSA